MPRTAATFSDSPAGQKTLSYSFIDKSGDRKSVSFEISDAATSAQIEAHIAAQALASNGNIFAIRLTQAFVAPAKASDAVAAEENSVHDAIVVHAKNSLNTSFRLWIPAPIRANFSGDTDNPKADSTELLAVLNTFETLTGATGVTSRYNEKAEKNEAVSF